MEKPLPSNNENSAETKSEKLQADQSTSSFEDLYKYRGKSKLSQEERRKQYLEDMRLRRIRHVNESRCLLNELNEGDEEMDAEEIETFRRRRICIKKYANRVMLSEWFNDIPSDLEQSWLCKLCPLGARRLVLATNKQTMAFNKKGVIKDWFLSRLPCGNRKKFGHKITLLDCVYNFEMKCYFVLDVLIWNSMWLQEGESDFRFFFVKSRLNDEPKLGEIDEDNHRRFVNVDGFPASNDLIEERMGREYVVGDKLVTAFGVLFYHKESSYIAGPNPLVGWLKPDTLPALFQISVPDVYLRKKDKEETKNTKGPQIEELCQMDIY